jgi:hypothetical protein
MNVLRQTYVERLEAMGVEQVRLRVRNELLETDLIIPAIGWLQDKAIEKVEQANRAAHRAKWAAWAAVALAIVGIIFTILK